MSRHSTLAALIVAAAALPLSVGCDTKTSTADDSILNAVHTVPPSAKPEEAVAAAATLEERMKDEAASAPRRTLAKAALAVTEMQTAQLLLAQVHLLEAQIHAKLFEMEQMTLQLGQNKHVIDAARQRDPGKALSQGEEKVLADAIKARLSAVRGGQGDAPWVKHASAPLPTLSAVKQTISTLTGKITETKGNIDKLTKQRDESLASAARLLRDSEAAQGEASQKLFVQSAEARKQAALLQVQIEQARAALVPLEQDLSAAQAHEKAATAAADALEATGKTTTEQFGAITAEIDKLSAASRQMIDGEKSSLQAKAAELAALQQSAGTLRERAVEQLKGSIQHFTDAVRESDALKSAKKDVKPGSPEDQWYADYLKTHDSVPLRLRQGEAQATLGAAHTSHAIALSRKAAMISSANTAATALAVQLPAAVADTGNASALSEAIKQAEESYTAAEETLGGVAEGTGGASAKATAELLRAAAYIGWAQAATLAGKTDDATNRQELARQRQKAAMDEPNTGLIEPRYMRLVTNTLPDPTIAPTPAPSTAPATLPAETTPPVEAPASGEVFGNPNQ